MGAPVYVTNGSFLAAFKILSLSVTQQFDSKVS